MDKGCNVVHNGMRWGVVNSDLFFVHFLSFSPISLILRCFSLFVYLLLMQSITTNVDNLLLYLNKKVLARFKRTGMFASEPCEKFAPKTTLCHPLTNHP